MLQDNITLEWDASAIAVVVAPYVVENRITTVCSPLGLLRGSDELDAF